MANADIHFSNPDAPQFIIASDELFDGVPVIFWNRETSYWDDSGEFYGNIVGHIIRDGRRWRVRWMKERLNELLRRKLVGYKDLNLINPARDTC